MNTTHSTTDHALSLINDMDLAALEAIRNAASARIEELKVVGATADIKVGDTVRLTDQIRPKYLAGHIATVTKLGQKTVVVTCGPDADNFANTAGVCGPRSIVEKVG